GASGLPARRRVPQRGGRLSGLVGGGVLHRGAGGARLPPLPRPVEPVSVPGLEPSAFQRLAAGVRPAVRLGDHGRQHLLPARRAERPGALVMNLDSKAPGGTLDEKWLAHRNHLRLVNPSNKRKFTVLVVGS